MDRKTALSDLANVVLEHTRIEDVIASRITLTKRGNRYVACCPFHQEKTPSFHINTQNQFFYCFGCKINGNAIHFLREYEKLTFIEALTYLARQAGISLPNLSQQQPDLKEDTECLAAVTHYFQQELMQSPKALDYIKQRNILPDIQSQFALGYAPDSWDALLKNMGKDPVKRQLLSKHGLLIEKTDRTWDRFRNRLIFPIRNPRGKTIAFGGRTLGDDKAKYLNSPQTPLFNKKNVLYGLFELLQISRQPDYVLMVEGYMDVIALHQAGIPFVVATLGTANNQQHLKTLQRYAKEIVFCFDGDAAGLHAAWHAFQEALPMVNEQVALRFLLMPNGEDPDSFVMKHGKETFIARIKSALSFSDFFFVYLEKDMPLNTIDDKARFASKAMESIERMPTGVFSQLMMQALADRLSLSTEALTELTAKKISAPMNATPPLQNNRPTDNHCQRLDHTIALLLQHPHLASPSKVKDLQKTLSEYEQHLSKRQALFLKLLAHLQKNPDANISRLITDVKHTGTREWLAECSLKVVELPADSLEEEFVQSMARILKNILQGVAQTVIDKAKQCTLSEKEQENLRHILQTIGKSCIQ